MKYEVGQEVRCVDDGGFSDLKVGDIYTITSMDETYLYVNNFSGGIYPSRFEPAGPKFKEGETVRVVGNTGHYPSGKSHDHGIEIGRLAIVQSAKKAHQYVFEYALDTGSQFVEEQDLEAVEDEAETEKYELTFKWRGNINEKEDGMKKVTSVIVIDNDENVKDEDSIVLAVDVYATNDSDEIIRHKMKERLSAGLLAEYNKKRIRFKDDKGDNLEKVGIKDLEIRIITH